MQTRRLPAKPDIDQLKHQAKDLLKAARAGAPAALERFRRSHPRFGAAPDPSTLTLADAQLTLAREHGFTTWPRLREHIEKIDTARRLTEQAWQARYETMQDVERRGREIHATLVAAVALAREAGAGIELVRALKALGQIERDSGHKDVAIRLYAEAVASCRAIGDPFELAHTIRHVADIHMETGDHEAAGPLYEEALALYDSAGGPPLDIANALRSAAIFRERTGHVEAAQGLWRRARALYAQVGIEEGIAESERHIGGA